MIFITLPFMRARGMALFPFVFFRESTGKQDAVLVNHERIHLRQQKEMLILPFYLFYFINYLYNLITTFNHHTAYRNIIFEQEAYDQEKDLTYLDKRKPWSFLNYI